jgi:hypothetical protein
VTPGGRALRGLAGRLALAVLVTGCLDQAVPSSAPTFAPSPEPTPTTTTYQLDTTVWYEGLLVHVDSVEATLDDRGGPVDVALRLENPTDADSDLDGRILLQAGAGDAPIAATRESKVPTAPANGTATTVLRYELQGVASIDRAVLLIGEAPLHVARVPLTAAGGAARVFEPITLKVAGANTAAGLRITLRHGIFRWDLPDWSEELGADVAVITLTYDVTYVGTFSGGFPFTGDNVALRLPDGTWVGPRRDGHSQSIELIGAGKTKKGLSSRFEVPSDATGSFALVVRDGSASRVIPFKVGT